MKTVFLRIEYPGQLWLDEDRPGTATVGPVQLPADLSVGGVPLDLALARDLVLKTTGATGDFRRVGQHLLGLLRAGGIGTRLDALRQANPDLRLYLDVRPSPGGEPNPLPGLPWELLHDGSQALCALNVSPVARLRGDLWLNSTLNPLLRPLRVLVVVGLHDDDKVGAPEGEVRRIQRAGRPENHREKRRESLSALDVKVLRRPETLKALSDVYKDFRPHVLHFVGHGDVTAADLPRLRFDLQLTPTPKMWGWTNAEIGPVLTNARWRPQLVILNACRSGVGTPDKAESSRSLGEAFLNAGVPAVVAMQGDIRLSQAEYLWEAFYIELAAGTAIDEALAGARFVVASTEAQGFDRRDWALPVLTLRCLPEQVLPILPRLEPLDSLAVESCTDFATVATFVDTENEKRSVYRAFHPPVADFAQKRQLVIVGPDGIGKTALARVCTEAAARNRHRICWIDLARTLANGVQRTAVSWLDLLRLICGGDWDADAGPAPIHRRPLPVADFHQFYWELNHRLADGSEPPWDGSPAVDSGLNLKVNVDRLQEKTFATFRTCLQAAAKRAPLYLVLDDFGGSKLVLPPLDFQRFVRPLLFDFIARADDSGLGPVHLILLVTEEERQAYGLTADLELKPKSPGEFTALAAEFFEYKYYDEKRVTMLEDDLTDLREIIAREWRINKNKTDWRPSRLVAYYAAKKEAFGW